MLFTIGRLAAVVYGLFFTLFCIAGTISDIQDSDPILETVGWLILSVVTCFGIFAFAIPQLQFRFVALAWRYVAYALPILVYSATAWEIWNGEPMGPIEFVAVLMLFLVITTPALVLNYMLHRNLNRNRRVIT